MAYAKQMRLVRKLADLTNAGALEWKQSVKSDVFQLSFRDNTLRIMLKNNALQESPDVEIHLINGEGNLVESFTDVDLQSDNENPPEMQSWYTLMSDLYEAARRVALGADKVLNEILSDLDDKIPF